ncbi:uncharacterized protein MYCFIDRAFT_173850 [Pseudocercospora fijiensis CIRAD86]|uniref:Uncharacterized protein n=1 Tax=Pseudocercospora fijiensis (strain CIRAD86) TaxID=383855 RepID=M3B6J9_PSEFD|nr:uncharacterized protein MYCFIDRAFT_173850 [Pseudocercospora fijiensis CIRAD86]EME84968.1 hypothetical protein MYCFIDRAFT_173850 [Pseudocercospora fijiensis CIRAD86]
MEGEAFVGCVFTECCNDIDAIKQFEEDRLKKGFSTVTWKALILSLLRDHNIFADWILRDRGTQYLISWVMLSVDQPDHAPQGSSSADSQVGFSCRPRLSTAQGSHMLRSYSFAQPMPLLRKDRYSYNMIEQLALAKRLINLCAFCPTLPPGRGQCRTNFWTEHPKAACVHGPWFVVVFVPSIATQKGSEVSDRQHECSTSAKCGLIRAATELPEASHATPSELMKDVAAAATSNSLRSIRLPSAEDCKQEDRTKRSCNARWSRRHLRFFLARACVMVECNENHVGGRVTSLAWWTAFNDLTAFVGAALGECEWTRGHFGNCTAFMTSIIEVKNDSNPGRVCEVAYGVPWSGISSIQDGTKRRRARRRTENASFVITSDIIVNSMIKIPGFSELKSWSLSSEGHSDA